MNRGIKYIYDNENEDPLTGRKNGLISTEDAMEAVKLALKQVKNNDLLHSVSVSFPSKDCDEACYYHCTKGGQQPPECINEH